MKHYLTLGAVIRNEEHSVREWLTFHRAAGVEFFVIVLHECTDRTEERIRSLPFADRIKIHLWSTEHPGDQQIGAYQYIFKNYRDVTQWIAILDGDEYLYDARGRDLKSTLRELEHGGGVAVPWAVFGHGNQVARPHGLQIDSYTLREPLQGKHCASMKCIVRTSEFVRCLSPHLMETRTPLVNEHGLPARTNGWALFEPTYDKLRINHYYFRSMEDWVARYKRGDMSGSSQWRRSHFGIEHFMSGTHTITDRAICRYSAHVREALGYSLHRANPDNTAFVAVGIDPDSKNRPGGLVRTSEKFGVPLLFADPTTSGFESKMNGLIDLLESQRKQGREYAFIFNSPSVVLTEPLADILGEFNLIYEKGVLFAAVSRDRNGSFRHGSLPMRIATNFGNNGFADGRLFCGKIDEILPMLRTLLRIRDQLANGRYEDGEVRMLLDDPAWKEAYRKHGEKLPQNEQLILHTLQMKPSAPVEVDTCKRLLAIHGPQEPPLHPRGEIGYPDERSLGTAGILCPMWEPDRQANRNAWIEREILAR